MTAELSVFKPRTELSAEANLAAFISHCCDELAVFGADLDFGNNKWDLTAYIHLKAKNSAIRAVFSSWECTEAEGDDFKPMPEWFLSFAKAYFRYQHALRPTKSIGTRLSALRALCAAALERKFESVTRLDRAVFNRAAQLITERYSAGVAYRTGGQLDLISVFVDMHRLCVVPIGFKNPIKRPANSIERVGDQFDAIRNELLPSPNALDALARAFRIADEPIDRVITSVAALMCATPDRVNEVLGLREACEYEGMHDGKSAYGLRYWPSKGAPPMVKWVIPIMSDVVKEAIARLRSITQSAREIACWYENNPAALYLPPELEHFRGRTDLNMQEVAFIVFEDGSIKSGRAWCKSAKLPTTMKDNRELARFEDVEAALVRMLPRGFPVMDPETGLSYSEALCVAKRNQFQSAKGTYRGVVEAIPQSFIADGLGQRTEHGFKSVFDRLGFFETGKSPIKIRTHQFRHYLNTLAQHGGLSELDIAKWSGRADIRHNSAYNHVSDRDLQAKLLTLKGEDEKTFVALVEQTRVSPVARARFSDLGVTTAHTTDFGYCVHDFAMSPCQLHADCINCNEQVCIKGDERTEANARAMLAETQSLLKQASEAESEGFYGASRWEEHQALTVARLRELVDILDNPRVMPGAVIRLMHLKAASRLQQAVEERKKRISKHSPQLELKWAVMSSGVE